MAKHRLYSHGFAGALLLATVAFAADSDPYGGWPKLQGTRTGYFHTQQIDGRWWLVTPDGNAFFSKGVDNVSFAPESDTSPKPPADTAAWAKRTVGQLRGWNLNTVGAWSSPVLYPERIAYTPIIGFAAAAGRDVWLKGGVIDYFSPEFHQIADQVAARVVAPRAKDPWVLGYFTDNELRWGQDWRSKESLLEGYLKMKDDSAGYRKATEFLKARGHSAANLSDDDKSEFLIAVAEEYGRVTREAIRKYDPNHLILGCRFAGYPGDTVMRSVGRYFDVISFHSYSPNAPVERLEQITRLTGRPTMITEFSFKAMDSGLPNTKGAARPVATQAERASGFAGYVEALAKLPACVGYHWFEYRDQPKDGRRLDGENSNYGLVKIDFTPWEALTERVTQVNSGLETLHAAAPFAGKRSDWQGFARYDFDLDGRIVTVVAPAVAAAGKPWLWRGEFFGAFPTVDLALLKQGWHVVYLACPDTFGSPDTMLRWETLHDRLTRTHGFSRRPVLLGMSRGGLYVYNWAIAHPDRVGLIYGDAPVCDVKSWPGGKGKAPGSARDWELFKKSYGLTEQQALAWKGSPIDILGPIAAAHIPIIHVVGDADDVVPVAENTAILKQRYEALGGHVEVIHKPGIGHHPHSLEDPAPIVDYILKNRLQ